MVLCEFSAKIIHCAVSPPRKDSPRNGSFLDNKNQGTLQFCISFKKDYPVYLGLTNFEIESSGKMYPALYDKVFVPGYIAFFLQ